MKKRNRQLLADIGDVAIGTGYLLQAKGLKTEDLKDLEKTLRFTAKAVRTIRKNEQLRAEMS